MTQVPPDGGCKRTSEKKVSLLRAAVISHHAGTRGVGHVGTEYIGPCFSLANGLSNKRPRPFGPAGGQAAMVGGAGHSSTSKNGPNEGGFKD